MANCLPSPPKPRIGCKSNASRIIATSRKSAAWRSSRAFARLRPSISMLGETAGFDTLDTSVAILPCCKLSHHLRCSSSRRISGSTSTWSHTAGITADERGSALGVPGNAGSEVVVLRLATERDKSSRTSSMFVISTSSWQHGRWPEAKRLGGVLQRESGGDATGEDMSEDVQEEASPELDSVSVRRLIKCPIAFDGTGAFPSA
mmetsp:Transcript_138581/g.276265  ORF Transcript_138581/g.276265 Transcript_138581/m.276265 type:complete len:204 (-) Transcript_138581:726-1337(-)